MTAATKSGNQSLFYRLFFDKELRSVTIQVITMALIFAFFFFIINNAITNLETIGKGYSFSTSSGMPRTTISIRP